MMEKKVLEDMTLEELWQLFPITLADHRTEWAKTAAEEMALLNNLLVNFSPTVSHIGSTAIPGIKAKPIIDILVEVLGSVCRHDIVDTLVKNGYIVMARCDKRISFNKGYTTDGYADKVFHIHVRTTGDNDEILFRDYLLSHPDAAREYEKLKLSLLPRFRNDRDGYTAAKTAFVANIITAAKNEH